ncbi:sulfatase [Tunicatimonas pelagia]|uniref:sulfatase n=1 Tax=Tunicatimonas pelagia TaxID=931531 RepID=UPI002666EF15|nr:sulfatase [Tunicatimonas pelagia]WKN42818.1 sulfatase [Tunicatimonas pelagia]
MVYLLNYAKKQLANVSLACLCWSILSCQSSQEESPPAQTKYNVLFIAIDDLRPQLGCYGETQIISPHIDRLASQSLMLTRAYVQQAVCAPSRNGVMTGLRPDAIGIYDLGTFFRDSVPNVVTLPQHFKNNGYQSESIGKIYHRGHGNRDDSLSWSRESWVPSRRTLEAEPIRRGDTVGLEGSYPQINGKRIPYYATSVPEEQLADNRSVNYAMERLKALQDTTFFMAVGLVKPHLPFVAPQRYWDRYDSTDLIIPNRMAPHGSPEFSLANFGELRKYHDIPPEGYLSGEKSRNLIHGYYASVTYIDDLVGQLLNKLNELNLAENTIVVLWGDHGWKLGEYGSWCKHSNYEYDTRIPLIVKVPGITVGQESDALVESVDIYPTLCELAGLPNPVHLQGRSMLPLITDPGHSIKTAAWSQYPRRNNDRSLMGYAMRIDRYRYVRWQERDLDQKIVARELYDHQTDPSELNNLATSVDNQQLVSELDSLFNVEYELAHQKTLSIR